MTRKTQNILYHTLPAVFWLLAVAGSVLPVLLRPSLMGERGEGLWAYCLPPVLVLAVLVVLHRIPRHSGSVEECFWVGLLLGIASYGMPTVLFLIPFLWVYLLYSNLFSFRSVLSTAIGAGVVAIWASVFIYLGWLSNPWADFFATKNLWAWIPTGSFLVAYIAATTVRQNLRVR